MFSTHPIPHLVFHYALPHDVLFNFDASDEVVDSEEVRHKSIDASLDFDVLFLYLGLVHGSDAKQTLN